MTIVTFTDNSLMPFGKFKGIKLANVPADYLLYLWDNMAKEDKAKPLGMYIALNIQVLKQQARNDNQLKR